MTASAGPAQVQSLNRGRHLADRIPAWALALLRAPLVTKIAGTYALVVVFVFVAIVTTDEAALSRNRVTILGAALAASLAASVTLTAFALRPLAQVEKTLVRVYQGDYTSRVSDSLLADDAMRRVAATLNQLLDGVNRDRERLRELAERVVSYSDDERVRLARELYDSTAQSTAALMLELSVVANASQDATTRERLERVRSMAANVLEDIRAVAQAAHPRLLDDQGLSAALQQLVREYDDLGRSLVVFEARGPMDGVDLSIASVVYRVAQAALRSAVLVRHARHVQIRAEALETEVVLEVHDDGHPEVGSASENGALEAVRHRMELSGGAFEQEYHGGKGRVMLRVARLASRHAAPPVATVPTSTQRDTHDV